MLLFAYNLFLLITFLRIYKTNSQYIRLQHLVVFTIYFFTNREIKKPPMLVIIQMLNDYGFSDIPQSFNICL